MRITPKILIWLVLIGFYFITRLVNLEIIPIFTDEAIYTYWAQVALHDPANRFISLEDGKQPLFIWLAAISQKVIADPLIASRLVSVFSGFGSLIGIYFLTKSLFDEKVAHLAGLLYIILPFTLLYDRMALFDSFLTMLGIWAVFFSVKLIQEPKLDNSLLTGFAIGLSTITKSSGFFFLYLLPFSLLIFPFKGKDLNKRFAKWFGYVLVSTAISLGIYNSLRLSPLFYIIGRKNLDFVRTISQVVTDPFIYFQSNAITLIVWIKDYIGWPLLILFSVGLFSGVIRKNLQVIFLSFYVLFPFLAELLFNKIIYPRFILFYFPYVIILISFAAVFLIENYPKYKNYLVAMLIIFLLLPSINSFKLLKNPPSAKIADSDAGQYLNDWPAGYGVGEIAQIIRDESKNKNVYIGTEGTFGLLPYALQIYFYGQNNVHLAGFWPVDENNLPLQILDMAQKDKTYFVFNENQKEITNPHLKLVTRYQKGRGNSYMRLYQVIPQ